MAANQRSLRLTDAFRQRLLATRQRLQAQAERTWPTIEALDGTDWPERTAAVLAQGQVEALRATSAYLAAYVQTETGRRASPPPLDRALAGKSADGRSLSESLRSPLIGTLGALKEGRSPSEALAYGLNRATRMVGVDFDHAHRTGLLQAIESDDRFDGWERVTTGTCAACASVAGNHTFGLLFQVHPSCGCVSQPVVRGVTDRFPVPTGAVLFAEKTREEQNQMVGPEAADRLRAGDIDLADLVAESRLDSDQPDFFTQAPVGA